MIERLPKIRGKYIEGARLDALTWFRVGGPAEVLFTPADFDDLVTFLKERPRDIPFRVVGVGSNLLVRDGGLEGVTIRLARGFNGIEVEGDIITAGAAALDVTVARRAQKAGLAGLEFYRGIPGAIGGALRMNAGSYGTETKDILIDCVALDAEGNTRTISVEDMGYSYRHSSVPEDWISPPPVIKAYQVTQRPFRPAWMKSPVHAKKASRSKAEPEAAHSRILIHQHQMARAPGR